jgi:hypothetical protein
MSLTLGQFKPYRTKELLRANAIQHVRDAWKNNTIDLCLRSGAWLREPKETNFDSILRAIHKPRYIKTKSRGVFQQPKDSTKENAEELAFNFFWISIIEKSFLLDGRASEAVAATSVKKYISKDYIAWLARRIARYHRGARDHWWSGFSNRIIIDVEAGSPPAACVAALLKRSKQVYFVATSSTRLKELLETLFFRFSKEQDQGLLIKLARRNLFWCISNAVPKEYIRCTFRDHDHLEISRNGKIAELMRLSGNHSAANLGWLEWLHKPEALDHSIIDVVSLLANGLLERHWGSATNGPLTVALRQIFLECLSRFCQHHANGDLNRTIATLRDAGWGFLGDQYFIEMFLQNYSSISPDALSISKHLPLSLDGTWYLEDVRNLNDLRSRCKTYSQRTAELWSSQRMSRHFLYIGQIVSKILVTHGFCLDSDDADLFVSLALGYPGHSLLPFADMKLYGDYRAPTYFEMWNQFEKFGESSSETHKEI